MKRQRSSNIAYKFVDDSTHIERGSIRLGSPEYYATIPSDRRDPLDSSSCLFAPGRVRIVDGQQRDFIVGGARLVDCENIEIDGGGMIIQRPYSRRLIFCMSWNRENARGRATDGTCYRVNIPALALALLKARPDLLTRPVVGRVQYREVSSFAPDLFHDPDPFVKGPLWRDEEEVRIVFEDRLTRLDEPLVPKQAYYDVDLGPRPDLFCRLRS